MTEIVGAVEIGGSHVSAARVDIAGACLDTMRRVPLELGGSRDDLLGVIAEAARAVASPAVERWGVATPGPFDYDRGVSLIRGVGKLDALYGVDLRDHLTRELHLARPRALRFLNDAQAFVLGEWWAGGARGHARAIGVTLGTGLGSGFLADGALVTSGPLVPPEGRVDLVMFRGVPVEDTLSGRAISSAYGDLDAAEIARRGRAGDPRARAVFASFGSALAEFLAPWVARFRPSRVVFGGSIAKAWDLFGDAFGSLGAPDRYGPADHIDEAPLLGVAWYAAQSST